MRARALALCLFLVACASPEEAGLDNVSDDGGGASRGRMTAPSVDVGAAEGVRGVEVSVDAPPPVVGPVDGSITGAPDAAPPLSCAKGGACPVPPVDYMGSRYLFVEEPKTWNAARAFCQAHGMDLFDAKALDGAERQWLVTELQKRHPKDTWHVGVLRSPDGVWTWLRGGDFNNLGRFSQDGEHAAIYPPGKLCAAIKAAPAPASSTEYMMIPVACDVDPFPFVCESVP